MNNEDKSSTIFREELSALINRHSKENTSDTPDFILARYLISCLSAFEIAVQQRETWYGRDTRSTSTTETEPTPTEMVKALLEKGWIPMVSEVESEDGGVFFREGENQPALPLEIAYRKAFPKKRKVTIDAWYCTKCGELRNNRVHYCINSETMVKGQFTYEVEE